MYYCSRINGGPLIRVSCAFLPYTNSLQAFCLGEAAIRIKCETLLPPPTNRPCSSPFLTAAVYLVSTHSTTTTPCVTTSQFARISFSSPTTCSSYRNECRWPKPHFLIHHLFERGSSLPTTEQQHPAKQAQYQPTWLTTSQGVKVTRGVTPGDLRGRCSESVTLIKLPAPSLHRKV